MHLVVQRLRGHGWAALGQSLKLHSHTRAAQSHARAAAARLHKVVAPAVELAAQR